MSIPRVICVSSEPSDRHFVRLVSNFVDLCPPEEELLDAIRRKRTDPDLAVWLFDRLQASEDHTSCRTLPPVGWAVQRATFRATVARSG